MTKIPISLIRKLRKKQAELDAIKADIKQYGVSDSYIRGLLARDFKNQ